MKARKTIALICLVTLAASLGHAQRLEGSAIRIDSDTMHGVREIFSIKVDGAWQPILSTASLVHVVTDAGMEACSITKADLIDGALVFTGNCSVGAFVQHVTLAAESDIVNIPTRLKLKDGASAHSVEDRYDFLPPRHASIDEHTGPLDFVWSQNIKSEADDIIPTNSFKSPALMMQQGKLFAALLPCLNEHHAETRALDLDVTSDGTPWIAYGAIPSQPHGHSYFRRAPGDTLQTIDNTVEYAGARLSKEGLFVGPLT